MFFKRLTKDKSAPKPAQPASSDTRPEEVMPAPPAIKAGAQPLASVELRRTVDAKSLGFKTTADLEPATSLIGQDRALSAIDFGLSMTARDFNIFVQGPPSSGKSTLVRSHLAKVAATSKTPSDWVYVNNFNDPRRPRALELPTGRAVPLSRGVHAALCELAATLPTAFQAEDYQARRRAIEEEHRSSQEDALATIHAKAAQQNIAVLRTPLGFGMAPMHDGKVVRAEVFSQLPEMMQRDVEMRIGSLQTEMETILSSAPKADKQRRAKLAELNAEVVRLSIEEALDEVSATFADVPEAAAFLADLEEDLIANAASFLTPVTATDPAQDARLRRYLVNVIVSREDKTGAPVCRADHPTAANLIGRAEHSLNTGNGAVADFLTIQPGALHRANGGVLMIDAKRVLAAPAAWESLKRALKSGEIIIETPETVSLAPAAVQTIEPQPIPLTVKVILFGEPEIFRDLEQTDPDFSRLFKVRAELDDTIARSKDNDKAYARLIALAIKTHGLKPLDADGVARLMEEAARLAEDREKLTLDVGRISDIIREADYWSDVADRKTTTGDDIQRAIKEHTRRADRAREQLQESIERGTLLIDTSGTKVGQINALSLVQKGGFCFGRPARITARVHLGQGRITDIEREVELGGSLHSKGVMILWGYLAGRFAQDIPLALAATLVVEQSYEAVEGDSASAAELFALMSALADAPLRQDLGVTGSVNQWGEVQAVGGVNEKIEGFFDICVARGLTGSQGVLIPEANRQHLMLREDVVAAVREGRFTIHAIKTVDEGVALLTGIEAGENGADGRFGAGTVNGRVEARLKAFADKARAFASGKDVSKGSAAGSA